MTEQGPVMECTLQSTSVPHDERRRDPAGHRVMSGGGGNHRFMPLPVQVSALPRMASVYVECTLQQKDMLPGRVRVSFLQHSEERLVLE
jgi:hypothetical protein